MRGDSRFLVRAPACSAGHGPAREAAVPTCGPFPVPAKEGQRVQGGPSRQCTAFYKKTAITFCPLSRNQTLPLGGCTCLRGKGSTDLLSSVSSICDPQIPRR